MQHSGGEYTQGLRLGIPIVFGYVPVAVAFGITDEVFAVASGHPGTLTPRTVLGRGDGRRGRRGGGARSDALTPCRGCASVVRLLYGSGEMGHARVLGVPKLDSRGQVSYAVNR
jgi:hypothetical protein